MIRPLYLIHAQDNSAAQYSVHYQFYDHFDQIEILFTIKSFISPWHTNASFSDDARKNWGLWNYDVVEVFWQNRTSIPDLFAPYYEWQSSPNDKHFCLQISRPRVSYHTPLFCPITFDNKLSHQDCWITSFKIPKDVLPPKTLPYIGLFAILGREGKRQFFSHHKQITSQPDFHRPEFFLPISSLS